MSESFQLQFEPTIDPLTYGLMVTLRMANAQGGGTWKTVEKHTLVPGKSFPLFKRLQLLGTTGFWEFGKSGETEWV